MAASALSSSRASSLSPSLAVRSATGRRRARGTRGGGQVEMDVVEVVELLVADLDDVAEPAGGEHPGVGASALDEGVGGEGRRVDDDRDVCRR